MKNALCFLAVSAIFALPLAAQTQRPEQASDARTRSIYVSVVNGQGEAVTGLTARDFQVREDGVAREVLRAEPAKAPLDIVLLVDDSQAATRAIPYLRDALPKFVERLEGRASLGLVTLGERPTSVVERTKDVAALKKGFSRIFARPGSGAYLLEAISEVSRGFRARDVERPVIVALSVEGIEFSNLQYQQVLEQLRESGAQLHVLAIGSPAPMSSDEIRNKSLVVAEGTEKTGGRREQLLSEMGIADTLDELAGELLNQYEVTYGRPDALVPPREVEVTVGKPGLTARARTWLPDTRSR